MVIGDNINKCFLDINESKLISLMNIDIKNISKIKEGIKYPKTLITHIG